MFAALAKGVQWLYGTALFAPIMNLLASKLEVPKSVIVTYGAKGFGTHGAKTSLIAIIVVVIVIAAVYFAMKKKGNVNKKVMAIVSVVAIVVGIAGTLGWTGWKGADDVMGITREGNADKYAPENVAELPDSPIKGKTIFWLGSSVVDGFGARHDSMAEFVSKRNGTNMIKDVYSGTYIATTSENDYLPRLLLHDATTDPVVDLVVVQLSTNDCKELTEVGDPTPNDVFDLDQFDTTTTCGALEYILGYSKETWGCPTLVFTSLWFDESATATGLQKADVYQEMVDKTKIICEKWDSYILDMWYDEHILDGIDDDLYNIYMTDSVHPSRRGYLEWWTPKFEEIIYQILGE